jgi:RNA-binding protein
MCGILPSRDCTSLVWPAQIRLNNGREEREDMTELKGFQKTYLRGIAHDIKPIVMIGKEGLVPGVLQSVSTGLLRHELIKIKFINFKEKEQKAAITAELMAATDSALVGSIGHTLIIYRQHPDPEKRRIHVPTREGVQ